MKRTIVATCLAGACAVALSAQTPTQQQPPTSTAGTTGATTTSQDTTAGSQRGRGGPMTVTGCLRAGDTAGTYMLTNVQGMGARRGSGTGTSGAGTSTTTAGGTSTTAGGAGTTAGGTGSTAAGGRGTIMLTAASDVDLKPHVGHQIEVTGAMAGRGGAGGAGSTTAGGTTTGGTTTGGGTTGGTTAGGTTAGGTTGSTGTGATTTAHSARGGMRSMTVSSMRMVSESCPQQ